MKPKPIVLTHKPPTVDEVGVIMGVSKTRVKQIKELCARTAKTKAMKKELPRYGYHTVRIKKGVLGETSKIQEELDELRDAELQGVKILIYIELSDLYGAIRAYAVKHNLKMADLHDMAKLTRRAFEQGYR